MIKSMTGYGSAKGEGAGMKLTVELKSVNNRYLDCSVRLPRTMLFAEEAVKAAAGKRISRGKTDIFITVDSSGADDTVIKLNESLAVAYAGALRRVAELTGGDTSKINAETVARFPDVLTAEKREVSREELTALLEPVLSEALDDFDSMRCREGEKLATDVLSRADEIERMVGIVEARSPQTVAEYREKLLKRMNEVLETTGADEQRILTEAAIFADRTAVAEETVRLRSHIAQLRILLSEGSPVGRKLDFLVQEFNREANTIGSKCSDAELAKTVVELKSEIEKIREQIQNIE